MHDHRDEGGGGPTGQYTQPGLLQDALSWGAEEANTFLVKFTRGFHPCEFTTQVNTAEKHLEVPFRPVLHESHLSLRPDL